MVSMRSQTTILLWVCGWMLLLVGTDAPRLSAQVESLSRRPTSIPTRSRSGQFLIVGEGAQPESGGPAAIRIPTGPTQRTLTLNPLRPMDQQGVATLGPPVLSVACERIKSGVLRFLRIEDRHRGSMVVRILKVDARRAPAVIVATQYADGWRYTLELQERVHWTLLVRTTVEAVLLEVANRSNEGPLSPIPLWLSEGLTTLLIGESGQELVPQLNREFKDSRRSMDPLAVISGKTAGRPPLGFDSMALPDDGMLADTNRFASFQGSSALLVHQLRSMGGPPGSLGRFVWELNRSLNWQTAFLRTYSNDFSSLLDVEKWWSVVAMAYHVQDSAQRSTPESLVAQVRSVLTEMVETSVSTNGVPDRRSLRISEIIEGWPYAAQAPVLERKLVQLRLLSRVGLALSRRDGLDEVSKRSIAQLERLVEILAHYHEARSGRSPWVARRGDLDPRMRLLVAGTAERLRGVEGVLIDGREPVASSDPGRTPRPAE